MIRLRDVADEISFSKRSGCDARGSTIHRTSCDQERGIFEWRISGYRHD